MLNIECIEMYKRQLLMKLRYTSDNDWITITWKIDEWSLARWLRGIILEN